MSDISPDQSTREFVPPSLSDSSPGAVQMSDKQQLKFSTEVPPLGNHAETLATSSSDLSTNQPATKRVTVRLPTADLTALDARADALNARADALNASRSDYLRTLIALPVALDLTSIRHATPGTESLTRPLSPDLALRRSDDQTTIQAITDSMLESISNEVRAIGVNYNQAVRAINHFLKKYGNHRNLSQEERSEIGELYDRLSKQNKAIYERLKALAADVESLSAKPTVNLTAVGLAKSGAPINKYEPERRRRVRGKKHGAARPDQMNGGDES